MAYPRPTYDNRSPIEPEHKRPPWDPIPRHTYHAMPPSSTSTTPSTIGATLFDPESEDSDVSITPGENVAVSGSALPQSLPPPPSKHALESPDTVQAHLNELSRVEDHNIKKHRRLNEKRARKDERIQRKRSVQDAKIKAIMDARNRRDARIDRRRQREDAAFQRFYDDLEEEENRLRHRLKRLKRGLPIDEQNTTGRSISSSSMSPPGPAYSTIPPPAKRHQTGPPGQNESPLSAAGRDQRPYQPINSVPGPSPVPAPAPAPSYQFYQSNSAPPAQQQPPYQAPYHAAPVYNNSPQTGPINAALPPRTAPTPSESVMYTVNGPSSSPHASRPPPLHAATTPNTNPPPRQSSANYDTRPPPPSTSGFATINHPNPPQSGFAAINSRPNDTPPIQLMGPGKDGPQSGLSRPHEYTPSRPYPNDGTPTSAPGSLLPSSNKRTPSTTHPYQMSEAFANRHHHCEKTDSLNRGIWTWYGLGGTQDNPTAPPMPMYLKCNHDGCGRIDWRTVHGLQCHIVKNHEQPKGTIGSLEKALEKYGVPVKDIEEIEKRDGLGSGGTMADPKNLKLKAKNKEAGERRDTERKGTPTSAGPTTMNYRGNHLMNVDSPTQSGSTLKPFGVRIKEDWESDGTPISERHLQGKATAGFAAVNNAWAGINSTPSKSQDAKDHEKRDGTILQAENPVHPASPKLPPKSTSHWPSWQASADTSKPTSKSTPNETLHTSQSNATGSNTVTSTMTLTTASFASPPATMASRPNGHANDTNSRLEENQKKNIHEAGESAEQRKEVEQSQQKDISANHEVTPLGDVNRYPVIQTKNDTQDAQSLERAKTEHITTNGADSAKDADEETMKPPLSTSDGSRSAMHSPEIPSKRVSAAGSRRGSRRSSMATSGSRNPADKEKEDGIDGIKDHERDGLPDDDDDGQTITVGGTGASDRQREKDNMDRTRTPPRRLANGRYMRKAR